MTNVSRGWDRSKHFDDSGDNFRSEAHSDIRLRRDA